jgi:hypothetical protein
VKAMLSNAKPPDPSLRRKEDMDDREAGGEGTRGVKTSIT